MQMFDAIARGEIKALWVMATNPAVSLPRAGAVRDAWNKLELFVVSENVASNDTLNAGAHILLPAAGSVLEADRALRPLVTDALIADLVATIPEAWLEPTAPFATGTSTTT